MATKKTQLKDSTTGEKMYPVTSSACVGMSDGSGSLDKHLAKITTEYNVSKFHPTGGSGGSNKYDLSTAIGKVPEELRVPGLVVSFLNDSNKVEKWEYQGGSWGATAIGCCSYDNNGADYGVLNSSIHVTNSKILLSLYNCSSLSSQPEKDCALTAQADGSRIATLATYNFVTNRVNKIKKSGSAQIIQIPEI